MARLRQAQVDLERTRILSPVNGYVTNLLAQSVTIEMSASMPSRSSTPSILGRWDFEETTLAPIRVGKPAQIKQMGDSQIVRGHVESIARRSTLNAQPKNQGVHSQPDLHLGALGQSPS